VPTLCYGGPCHKKNFPVEMAQTNRYKNEVNSEPGNKTVLDTTIWKFKDQLVEEVKKTLEALKFEP
jgi:hypothetical protein